MAKIRGHAEDSIFSIRRWLGVNESPDGDINLKMGEAAAMTNFKITSEGSLQKRPGAQNIANLLFNYDIGIGDLTVVATDINAATSAFTVKPNLNITNGGVLYLEGAASTMNASNIGAYDGYYYKNANGSIYRIGTCEYVPASVGTHVNVTGGSVIDGESFPNTTVGYGGFDAYPALRVSNGTVTLDGVPSRVDVNHQNISIYKYANIYGFLYKVTRIVEYTGYLGVDITRVYFGANDEYKWKFYAVSVVPNTTDSQVRGIWAGRVAGTEVICAACNNRLWQLFIDENGEWTKEQVGTLNTEKPVHFFGFGTNLYMLNGSEYKVWDGTTLSTVDGYRPLVAVSVPPAGGGTALERVNMLNGSRRIWASPDGTATVFTLPEKGLLSVDYVKVVATGASLTISSSSLANGTVTLTAAPTVGTNTIEIGYTVTAALRPQIVAMTLSESYNGAADNRVFIYGDGTNKAFYSDVDYDGQARADYFPDLNVVHVGEANAALTSMVRHYDRLLAFKEDAAYSIRYDTLTLASGIATAGFYVSTINKGVGTAEYGQAVVVENHPRTLDGRSIYQWVATSTSGNITPDQRNAQRISQNVSRTLREVDFTKAITLYDKVNREYFIVENGLAIVQNLDNGAWYTYRDFPALCMIVYKDELYYGTADGFIRHVSRAYRHDCGAAIQCYFESGSMDFGMASRKKLSDMLWVVLKPEDDSELMVTVQTDKQSDYEDLIVVEDYTATVATGFFDWLKLSFPHFSFNINDKPHTQRRKLKVKNFTWYKLILSTSSSDTTATVLNVDIKVRPTSMVR